MYGLCKYRGVLDTQLKNETKGKTEWEVKSPSEYAEKNIYGQIHLNASK